MSRSKNKGPYIYNQSEKTKIQNIVEVSRSIEITPSLLGISAKVHTGRNFEEIVITDEMIGHKVGEFSPTRAKFEFKKKKKK